MQLIADHEKLQSIMSSSKINIITILMAFIFILCSQIIILNTPPAAGYEISFQGISILSMDIYFGRVFMRIRSLSI